MICCPRCEYHIPDHKLPPPPPPIIKVVPGPPAGIRTVMEVLVSFNLRPKELQAATLLAEGLRIREVAFRMGTTQATVKNYLRGVYSRTGTSSRQLLRMKIDDLRIGRNG